MPNIISVGQIIDKTWDHYLKYFHTLMKISLWALLVAGLMLVRIFIVPEGETLLLLQWLNEGIPALAIFRFIIGSIISLAAIPVIVTWIFITLVRAIGLQASGKTVNVKQLQRESWKYFWPYVLVIVLKSLVIVSPLLALLPGVALTIFNQVKDSGTALSMLALVLLTAGIIAALYLVVKWGIELAFTGFEMLLNGKRGRKALSGSRALVKGHFWQTLVRIVIPKIVFGVFVIIGEALIALTSIMASIALFNINEWLGIYGSFIIITILGMGLRILYAPIFIVADYLIYDSLGKSK